MAGLSKTEYRGPISINLSAGQVQDESLLDDLVRLCLTTSLTMDRIFIEIAEPAFQRSTDAMLRRTDQLRATGVGVVLDDLGLDKLTLGFLERLRPTQVKLSRTLVQQLIHRPSAAPFVRAVTELGRSMGYEVVAKGTEDMRIASEALALGCTFGQGYFFSRPMPLAAILPVAGDIAMAAHR